MASFTKLCENKDWQTVEKLVLLRAYKISVLLGQLSLAIEAHAPVEVTSKILNHLKFKKTKLRNKQKLARQLEVSYIESVPFKHLHN